VRLHNKTVVASNSLGFITAIAKTTTPGFVSTQNWTDSERTLIFQKAGITCKKKDKLRISAQTGFRKKPEY
jgi:hypothetical protein